MRASKEHRWPDQPIAAAPDATCVCLLACQVNERKEGEACGGRSDDSGDDEKGLAGERRRGRRFIHESRRTGGRAGEQGVRQGGV